jgi:hypothetical protein
LLRYSAGFSQPPEHSLLTPGDLNVEADETACRASNLVGSVFDLHLLARPSGHLPPHLWNPVEIQEPDRSDEAINGSHSIPKLARLRHAGLP